MAKFSPLQSRPVKMILAIFVCGLTFGIWDLVHGAEVPSHVNHTTFLAGEMSVNVDGLYLSVVALGDLVDRREMIVWLEIENPGEGKVFLFPSRMKARTGSDRGNGEWREASYHCKSQRKGGLYCGGINFTRWLDASVVLEGSTSVGCWVVFGFSKSEFDPAHSIALSYHGSNLTIPFSSGRRAELTPALEMVWPRQGVWYNRPERVRFLIWDRFVTWNWTVTIDGTEVQKGSEDTGDDLCPGNVVFDVSSLENGYHTVVVSASDGVLSETSRTGFVINPGGMLGLRAEWVFSASSHLGAVIGPGRRSGFTAWDLEGDGVKELVFGNRDGDTRRIWCVDAGGGLEWIYPPMEHDGLAGDPKTKASLVDLNGDGVYELCLTDDGGKLHVLNPDGSLFLMWDNPLGKPITGPPQGMDVDGDRHVEFFLVDDTGYLYRVNHTGKTAWSIPVSEGLQGTPTLADIDSDGIVELLWTSFDGSVWCVSSQDGFVEWRYSHLSQMAQSDVIVVDLNGDTRFEAVTWTTGRPFEVLVLDSAGREAATWTSPYNDSVNFGQAIGDIDGDGSLDLVLVTGLVVRCLGFNGVQPYAKWEIDIESWVDDGRIPSGVSLTDWSPYQLIADIDGDSEQEILLALPYPMVVDGATGELESYYLDDHIALYKPHTTGSWWGDIDDDGVSEWVIELEGHSHRQTRVYCLTMDGEFPARSPWPEYHHSAYPAEHQCEQEWLTLKAAGSNSLWFTEIRQTSHTFVALLALTPLIMGLAAKR
jgi:hypothetical protein